MKKELIKQIAVTWEICAGKELSAPAMKRVTEKLDRFSPEQVERALSRCEDECKGRITIADVISRIDDGHLGADEAWALMPQSEADTVVWTTPMMQAYDIAKDLLPDRVAARMAFKDSYNRSIQVLKEITTSDHRPVWWISIGQASVHRDRVVKDAIQRGRIQIEYVAKVLPELADDIRGALPAHDVNQIEGEVPTESELTDIVGQLKEGMGKTKCECRSCHDERGICHD